METGDEPAGGRGALFAQRIEREEIPEQSPVVELEAYWNSLPRSNGLPSRRDIDPVEIGGELLPWIFLLDVLREDGQLDYLYRLSGTSNVELVGRDSTGRRASEIFGSEERAFLIDTFDVTVAEKVPTYWYAEVPQEQYDSVKVYRGLFPLADDGVTVDKLICAAAPSIT
jgi:hypothetical protein